MTKRVETVDSVGGPLHSGLTYSLTTAAPSLK